MGYGQIKPSGRNGGKKIYYEWMRCIACFLVIFNHLKGYTLFMNSTGIKQVIYMILSVLTKINVPLFFYGFWRAAAGEAGRYFYGFQEKDKQDLPGDAAV